jgi:hypothetical protein
MLSAVMFEMPQPEQVPPSSTTTSPVSGFASRTTLVPPCIWMIGICPTIHRSTRSARDSSLSSLIVSRSSPTVWKVAV